MVSNLALLLRSFFEWRWGKHGSERVNLLQVVLYVCRCPQARCDLVQRDKLAK